MSTLSFKWRQCLQQCNVTLNISMTSNVTQFGTRIGTESAQNRHRIGPLPCSIYKFDMTSIYIFSINVSRKRSRSSSQQFASEKNILSSTFSLIDVRTWRYEFLTSLNNLSPSLWNLLPRLTISFTRFITSLSYFIYGIRYLVELSNASFTGIVTTVNYFKPHLRDSLPR